MEKVPNPKTIQTTIETTTSNQDWKYLVASIGTIASLWAIYSWRKRLLESASKKPQRKKNIPLIDTSNLINSSKNKNIRKRQQQQQQTYQQDRLVQSARKPQEFNFSKNQKSANWENLTVKDDLGISKNRDSDEVETV